MRTRLVLCSLAMLLASPLAAQPSGYAVVASQADLADGTAASPVPTCPVVLTAPGPSFAVTYFDTETRSLVRYDAAAPSGGRSQVVVSADALASAAGGPVTTCLDVEAELDAGLAATGVVFLLLATESGPRLLRVGADGDLSRLVAPSGSAGMVAVAHVDALTGRRVFVARATRAGAPADGIYGLEPSGSDQALVPEVLDDQLDLVSLASGGVDALRGASRQGAGPYENVVVGVTGALDARFLFVADRPCTGARPIFDLCTDGLGDVVVTAQEEPDGTLSPLDLVTGLTPQGADGIVVGGLERVAFVERELVLATGVAGFRPSGTSYLALARVEPQSLRAKLLLASAGGAGSTVGIYAVDAPYDVRVASEAPPDGARGGVRLTPNPARRTVDVRVDGEWDVERVVIRDRLGRRVVRAERAGRIDVSGLARGSYTATVEAGGRTTHVRFTKL